MAKNCNNKNPLTRGGTSQPQRLRAAIQKDYVQIDEHGYADLLLFAKKFARHLKYYNLNNQPDGTWEEFFSYDVSILVSFIADNDIRTFDATFRELLGLVEADIQNIYDATNLTALGNLKAAVKNNLASHFSNYKKLFDFILSFAYHIDQQVKRLPKELGLKAFAENTIQQHCNTPFNNLLGFHKAGVEGNGTPPNYVLINPIIKDAFPDISVLQQQYTQEIIQRGLSFMWLSDEEKWVNIYAGLNSEDYLYAYGTNTPPAMTKPLHVEQWIRPALKEIESIYNSLSKAFYKMVSESLRYLEETLNEWPNHTPHIALYLSFLKLFRFAQNNLNDVKERHIEYYYKEILRLNERPSKPDKAFVLLELVKHIDDFLLEKQTTFKAGKDSEGNEVFYDATTDTAINKASVAQLKSIYHTPSNGKIYAAPIANSEDGLGEDLTSEDGHWNPFGPITKFIDENAIPQSPQGGDPEINELFTKVDKVAEIGFAIASPNLFLAGGTRSITIEFKVANINEVQLPQELTSHLKILFSGEEGWVQARVSSVEKTSVSLKIECELLADVPKIVPYDPKIHEGTFKTKAPLAKILLQDIEGLPHGYKSLKKLIITQATLTVKIKGLKDFVAQNDVGRLDLSKPILPFSATAPKGASFIIGSKEVFQKKLVSALNVNFEWNGWDGENIRNVFQPDYPIHSRLDYLEKNEWVDGNSDRPLIEWASYPFIKKSPPSPKLYNTLNEDNQSNLQKIGRATLDSFDFSADEPYTPTSKDGFIRFTLKNSFGHKEYPAKLSRALIELSREVPKMSKVDNQFKCGENCIEIKDPPYTPSFKELSLDYTAQSVIELSTGAEEDFGNRAEQFFHIHPFGQREMHSILNEGKEITLLPQYDFEGNLYIGLKDINPQQSVAVLFQLAEGSANPLKKKQAVEWFYLYNNHWIAFKNNEKANLNDQTNGLLQSGLITFFFPKKINTDNTWLDTGHGWLKASVKNDSDAICNIIDIKAQAARLQFTDQNNADDLLAAPLAGSTIKKLLHPNAEVKKIEQPFTSFGGKLKEQPQHFFKRVSERLRHKDRAITIWDYEHLVLEEFPEIYKVKCLNHTQLKDDPTFDNRKLLNGLAPGHVMMVTIPDLKNRNAVSALKPYTSLNTLDKIATFLKKRISPHVKLEMVNPLFEEIELDLEVAFRENIDFTLYKKLLNQDILRFLSPWAFEDREDPGIEFGGNICKSVVLDYIDELPYVDFVTHFKMNQLIGLAPDNLMDVEEATATTSRSILVSVSQHKISEVIHECV